MSQRYRRRLPYEIDGRKIQKEIIGEFYECNFTMNNSIMFISETILIMVQRGEESHKFHFHIATSTYSIDFSFPLVDYTCTGSVL